MKNGRPGTRSVCAERPPTKKLSAQERAKLKVLRKSATVSN